MTPDMLRARNAGAEAIVVWSTSTGMDARLFNTRATMGWDVAFVGHPSMSSGDVKSLLEKPAELGKGLRRRLSQLQLRCERQASAAERGVRRQAEGQGESLGDTLLWWVAGGVDAINLIAKAVEATGSSASEDIIEILEQRQEISRLFRRLQLLADRT